MSRSIGIDMPIDFPTNSHNAVAVKLGSYRPRAPDVWAEHASGWNAVASRYKLASRADEKFTASITLSVPTLDEYQVQAEALFIFFTAGYASIESFTYALFALGALLKPIDFPMSKPEDRKAINP